MSARKTPPSAKAAAEGAKTTICSIFPMTTFPCWLEEAHHTQAPHRQSPKVGSCRDGDQGDVCLCRASGSTPLRPLILIHNGPQLTPKVFGSHHRPPSLRGSSGLCCLGTSFLPHRDHTWTSTSTLCSRFSAPSPPWRRMYALTSDHPQNHPPHNTPSGSFWRPPAQAKSHDYRETWNDLGYCGR